MQASFLCTLCHQAATTTSTNAQRSAESAARSAGGEHQLWGLDITPYMTPAVECFQLVHFLVAGSVDLDTGHYTVSSSSSSGKGNSSNAGALNTLNDAAAADGEVWPDARSSACQERADAQCYNNHSSDDDSETWEHMIVNADDDGDGDDDATLDNSRATPGRCQGYPVASAKAVPTSNKIGPSRYTAAGEPSTSPHPDGKNDPVTVSSAHPGVALASGDDTAEGDMSAAAAHIVPWSAPWWHAASPATSKTMSPPYSSMVGAAGKHQALVSSSSMTHQSTGGSQPVQHQHSSGRPDALVPGAEGLSGCSSSQSSLRDLDDEQYAAINRFEPPNKHHGMASAEGVKQLAAANSDQMAAVTRSAGPVTSSRFTACIHNVGMHPALGTKSYARFLNYCVSKGLGYHISRQVGALFGLSQEQGLTMICIGESASAALQQLQQVLDCVEHWTAIEALPPAAGLHGSTTITRSKQLQAAVAEALTYCT